MVYKLTFFHIVYKAIQDGLPSLLLKFGVVFRFRVESRGDIGLSIQRGKQGGRLSAIRHGVGDFLMLLYPIINAFKVKPEAAILGFHPILEFAPYPQVV